MKTKVLIRIAAILIFMHFLGHSMGHMGWDKPADPNMQDVVKTMKNHSAFFMGANRSLADYFTGYSVILFGVFLMSIAILLILSQQTENHPYMVKNLLLPIGLTYFFFGIVEFIYFFPFAACISLGAGIFIFLAYYKLKSI